MSTLPGRSGTALLVVDVQNGVVGSAIRRDEVVGAIGGLVGRARAAHAPVVWVRNVSDETPVGSEGFAIVPELQPAPGEAVVDKEYGDSFEATELEAVLAAAGVGRLVVTGAQSDACVRATLHGALVRGYDTTLVGDAHTTEDLTEWGAPPPEQVVAHTNLYWSFTAAPGRETGVVDAADVTFG